MELIDGRKFDLYQSGYLLPAYNLQHVFFYERNLRDV